MQEFKWIAGSWADVQFQHEIKDTSNFNPWFYECSLCFTWVRRI